MSSLRTRHASANIMSNPVMRAAQAKSGIEEVSNFLASRAGSIGWQEIAPDNYQGYLRKQSPRIQTFFPGGTADAIPISWSSDLQKVASGVVQTHAGELHVTPARFIAWVVLQDSSGQKFWHVNTHFISAAFTSHPNRRARWEIHNAKLNDVVRQMQADHGSIGIVTGDFNRSHYQDPSLLAVGARYHWPSSGTHGSHTYYDYLISFGRWGSPSPVTKRDTTSDHDAVFVDLTLPSTGAPASAPPPSGSADGSNPPAAPVVWDVPGATVPAPWSDVPVVSVWRHLVDTEWRKAATVGAPTSLQFTPTFQDAGSWTLTAPYDVGRTLLPGRLVTIDFRGKRSTWLIDEPQWEQGDDDGGSLTMTVSGAGAKAMLGWCTAFPDATNVLEAQPIYLDTKAAPVVGKADTVLATLAARNLRDRRGVQINVAEPAGTGGTVKIRPKFDNLFELTQTHAKDGGVAFDIGLENISATRATLWLRFWEPVDKSDTVRLTSDLRTIGAWKQVDTAPVATHAIVGYGQNFSDVQTTLAQDVSASSTFIVVASSNGFPVPDADTQGFRIVIGDELLYVTKVVNKTWTVTRGGGATSAAAHTAGDPIRATRLYKEITTPTSLTAAAEWGGPREVYVEGPDSKDPDEVAASGRASLSDGAETRALTVRASEAEGMRAFVHYDVGDIATAEVLTGASATANITAIEVTVDESGVSVKPTFGNPGSVNSTLRLAQLIRGLWRAERKRARE